MGSGLAAYPVAYDAVVTIELACDRPDTVTADTIGAAWPGVARRILADGIASRYETRLFDYEHSGRDQVAWVIDRLRGDPSTRSAAITTFQPHTDTSYIPCVSLLDFRLPGGAVELVAYAHSIDFGA